MGRGDRRGEVGPRETPIGCARFRARPGGASEVEAVENARVALRTYLAVAHLLAAEKPAVQIEICA